MAGDVFHLVDGLALLELQSDSKHAPAHRAGSSIDIDASYGNVKIRHSPDRERQVRGEKWHVSDLHSIGEFEPLH
jgi:hypothetical protein